MSCTRQSLGVSLGAAVGSARPGSRAPRWRSAGRFRTGARALETGLARGRDRDRANRRGSTRCDRRRRDTDVCIIPPAVHEATNSYHDTGGFIVTLNYAEELRPVKEHPGTLRNK